MATTKSPAHTLKIDYTNHSAQILDSEENCVAIYSHFHGRSAMIVRLACEGWLLHPDDNWTYTSPPDGRQHPLIHRPHPEVPVPDPLPLHQDTDDAAEATRIVNHFGPGSSVVGVLTDGPHSTIHRADLAAPRAPHCGMTSHGVLRPVTSALGVVNNPGAHAVVELLTGLGLDACRACRRCWRPTWQLPRHDRQRCFGALPVSPATPRNRSAMFFVQFTTDSPEFAGFGDGDAIAETLRGIAKLLTTGHNGATVTDKADNPIGRWGFEPDDSTDIETLRSDLADLRHRIDEALGYLMSAPQHEYVESAADILRGDDEEG